MTNYRNIRKLYTTLYPSTKKLILVSLLFSLILLGTYLFSIRHLITVTFCISFIFPIYVFLYYLNRQTDVQKEYHRLQLEYMETLKKEASSLRQKEEASSLRQKEALAFEKDNGLPIFSDYEKYPDEKYPRFTYDKY